MKNIKFILPILLVLFLFSCVEDDTNPEPQPFADYSKIDVITGMDFFDFNGLPVGRWGFPNHKTTDDIYIYPNPATGVIYLSSQVTIKRVWLVAADCFKDSITMNIPTLSQDLNFPVADLQAAQIKDIPTPDFMDAAQFDFSDVATGFYKLFYQKDNDEIFWHNIYIDPTVNNFPDLSFMDNNCL